jgi:hypothetical protein
MWVVVSLMEVQGVLTSVQMDSMHVVLIKVVRIMTALLLLLLLVTR